METEKISLINLEDLNMKKIAVILLFISFFSSSYAQQQFKAKDGISASTKAAADGGIKSPELVLIATSSEQLEGLPITISFDLSKGTANAWLYLYRSAVDKDSVRLIAVTKILNNYIPLPIPITGGGNLFPFRMDTTLNNGSWFDSDIMAQKIRENSIFQDYSETNKDFKLMLTYISINPLPEPKELQDKAIWGIILNSSGGRLSCLVHGETGEVFCQQFISGIDSDNKHSLSIINNPASDYLYLNIPLELQNENNHFLIYNSNGALIKKFSHPNPGISELIYIPLNNFGNGVYFITYLNSNYKINLPFIVIK